MVGAFLALILLTSVGIILKLTLRVVCSSYFQGLSASDSLYAVFWGVRFDLAISVLFLAPSVLMIYFLARFFKMTSFRLWWFTIPFSFLVFIRGGDGIYFEGEDHFNVKNTGEDNMSLFVVIAPNVNPAFAKEV